MDSSKTDAAGNITLSDWIKMVNIMLVLEYYTIVFCSACSPYI